MTDKTAALRALIEAVEAGSDILADFDDCFTVCPTGNNAIASYHGSLDAAKALHEALLPGWDYIIGHTNGGLTIHVKLEGQEEVFSDTPARAWLLAILRAYLYEQENK